MKKQKNKKVKFQGKFYYVIELVHAHNYINNRSSDETIENLRIIWGKKTVAELRDSVDNYALIRTVAGNPATTVTFLVKPSGVYTNPPQVKTKTGFYGSMTPVKRVADSAAILARIKT